jgi:DNA-binding NtrC family response regulator
MPELTPAAEQLLLAYSWPGNIRELKNMTERLVVRASDSPITPEDLPREVHGQRETQVAPALAPAADDDMGRRVSVPRHVVRASEAADRLWQRLMAGEDFWTVVHQPFKAHELTRDDLAALIDRGLRHTRGSYRALLTTFGLPTSDYKRFHAFLYQQNCNLPVGPYRSAKVALRNRSETAYSPAC